DSSLVTLLNGSLSWSGMTLNGDTFNLEMNEPFADQLDLDAKYPSTNYTISFDYSIPLLQTSGKATANIELTGDSYPNAPTIVNFPQTQAVPEGRDFVLQFQPFQGATTNDSVLFAFADGTASKVLYPDYNATTLVIPRAALKAGANLFCILT